MKKFIFALILSFSALAHADQLLAINVALAVNGKLQSKVDTINHDLKNSNPNSFLFDSTHVPHLTILQIFINTKDLDFLIKELSVKKNKVFRLKVKDFESSALEKDPSLKLLNLVFETNDELASLQKALIASLGQIVKNKGTKEAFVEPASVEQQFVNYVNEYTEKEAGSNYSPHITLGIVSEWDRDNSYFKPKDEFLFDEIIISQMGNYGSVRKIFKTVKLNSSDHK